MTDLPVGWTAAPLGDLVDVLDSRRVPVSSRERAQRPGAVPYYGATGRVGSIDQALFDEDLVLLGEDGVQFFDPFKPKAYLISGPAWVNNHAHVIRPRGMLDRTYLHHFLNTFNYRGFANGTTRLKLTQNAMKKIPVPVPPLVEQRRIVAALEGHLSAVDSGRRYLVSAQKKMLTGRLAVARSAVRGLLSSNETAGSSGGELVESLAGRKAILPEGDWPVPPSWAWSTIGDLFKVFVGSTPSRSDPKLWDGPVPWVSSGEVSFCRISTTRETISRDALGKPATRLHPPGTVLLAMIGEGKTRGQAAILDIEAAHNQNCASIRVSETSILPEYVYTFLTSRYSETRRAAAGGQQLALNRSTVCAIKIPIPPLDVQQRIVERVKSLSESESRLSEELRAGAQRSDQLYAALLRQAFAGNLVAQDPDDEPASELLARIRAEQAAAPPKQKARSRRTQKELAAPPTRVTGDDYQQEALPL
ncbi:restriction endonuclease subunit S [Micromonospora sp. NBC_00617]|uniref:restriction endonuclease subunit S n=1 Tax=Micromonospora sp. NBC_00617 TaxID=2903587 RepID=UPI0030E3EBBE